MRLFEYNVAWRFSSENWEVGVVKAETKESAEEILKQKFPDAISINVYDTLEPDDNEVYAIYSTNTRRTYK